MSKKPTDEELSAARAVLARANAGVDPAKDALVELVMMPEFAAVEAAMHKAQDLNRGDANLSYAISMFVRLRTENQPS